MLDGENFRLANALQFWLGRSLTSYWAGAAGDRPLAADLVGRPADVLRLTRPRFLVVPRDVDSGCAAARPVTWIAREVPGTNVLSVPESCREPGARPSAAATSVAPR